MLDLSTALGFVVSLSTKATVSGARSRAAVAWAGVAADFARVWAAVATSPTARVAATVRQNIHIKLRVTDLATKAAGLGRRVHGVLAAGAAPIKFGLTRPLLDAMNMKHSVALRAMVYGLLTLDNVVADHTFILIRINLRDKFRGKSAVAFNVWSCRANLLLRWFLYGNR